ncbi:unnamed protein product [Fusarium equiseti]|uniref:Uncharacterized protein n=1 Tax=Fusarium equiseti TaxID=61235 RepID=A0A8J2NCI3_FUSEQ|nr:unnamed protein product [Fusarium equiseti]
MLHATERRYRGQELCHEDLGEHESWVFYCGPHRRSPFKIPLVGTPPSFSAVCSATDFTLRLLDREPSPELAKEIEQAMGRMGRSGGLTSLVDQSFKRWDIPDRNDLAMAGRRSHDRQLWKSVCSWQGPGGRSMNKEYKLKFRFSAASAAIRFLKHLPANKRLCIRNLVLREDGFAVGQQERHSVGLILYCKENPRLRIDQRLGMVKNIFQAAGLTEHGFSLIHCYATRDRPEDIFFTHLGMPKDSFTLTLDGECVPDICSDFFQQIVLRNVAIQQAIHQRFPYPAGIIPSEDLWERINPYCIQASKCLVNQSSILRSNFHPGVMWDVDKLIADHPEYEHRQWWQLYWNTGHYTIPDSIHSVPLASMLLENYEFRKIRQRNRAQDRQYESWYH